MGLSQELAQAKGPCPSTRPIDLWIGLGPIIGPRVGPITKPKSILQYKVFWLVRLLYTWMCVLLTFGAKELVGCVEIGKCRDLIHVMWLKSLQLFSTLIRYTPLAYTLNQVIGKLSNDEGVRDICGVCLILNPNLYTYKYILIRVIRLSFLTSIKS